MNACPVDAINYMAGMGKVQKFDLYDGGPKCVRACPTADITYVDADLRDAAHLWGKICWKTDETIKRLYQDAVTWVCSLGGASGNGVLYTGIINDLDRAPGRSVVSAVIGSKNLKAVAICGTKGISGIRNFPAFLAATTAAKKVLADSAVTGHGLPTYGTQVLMNVIKEMVGLPTRNHRDMQFEGAGKI